MTREQIKDIAENLDCGFRCFIHRDTREVKFVPDRDRFPDMDTDPWAADYKEIKRKRDDYIEIDAMSSGDSFRLMADFVDTVDDNRTRARLEQALNGSKPFRNFKFQIDNSGPFRIKWFEFKETRLIAWVEDMLKAYNL